jgi:hypothetical protein
VAQLRDSSRQIYPLKTRLYFYGRIFGAVDSGIDSVRHKVSQHEIESVALQYWLNRSMELDCEFKIRPASGRKNDFQYKLDEA